MVVREEIVRIGRKAFKINRFVASIMIEEASLFADPHLRAALQDHGPLRIRCGE